MTSVARAERELLCDLALEVGPDAPTLCGDWTVRDLAAHLVVRERSVWGAPGIVLPPLKSLTDKAVERAGRGSFEELVEKVRHPRSPLALPGVDTAVNTIEFFVHHEDVRRARADWEPRDLELHVEDVLWRLIRVGGRGLVRPAGVPVVIRRRDGGEYAALRKGEGAAVVTGRPSELVLYLYGRAQVSDLEFSGPDDAVRRLREAQLGF